ncbi:hypothetical protein FB45DRAFT_864170 [Roridomyces roridus]|uniref:Uncharacterized protein n=1 Tax=Roridomyces roridus TaxID=1738132 RepID=A0AAD7C5M0_9AGAR|nr:hypothetical protein FB45DRAFT_864170 [Roridomyces roridus]
MCKSCDPKQSSRASSSPPLPCLLLANSRMLGLDFIRGLARRTLRTGKEFSPFDLSQQHAIQVSLDIGETLKKHLQEQDESGNLDEDLSGALESLTTDDSSLTDTPPVLPITDTPKRSADVADLDLDLDLPPPSHSKQRKLRKHPALDDMTRLERNKAKGHLRRGKQRERKNSGTPMQKAVHGRRIEEAVPHAIETEMNAADFPHASTGWIGMRAGKKPRNAKQPAPSHEDAYGMGGRQYTQEEVDKLTGTVGFAYIAWLGIAQTTNTPFNLTIPIIDIQRRIIVVLGGMPRDEDT